MRFLRFILLGTAALIILACAGSGGLSDLGPRGVGFSAENPNTALAGQDVTLLVFGQVAATNESGSEVAITGSTSVGTLSETTWTQFLDSSRLTYHTLTLHVPANATAGTAITVHVSRPVERIAGHPVVDEDTLTINVGTSTLTSTIAPATVNAQAGSMATATLSILPVNAPAGQVTVTSLYSGVTVSPSTFSLTNGQTTPVPVLVSYSVPAGAAPGSVIDLPIVYQSNAGHGGAIMHIVVQGQAQPDFAFSLEVASVFLTPGDSSTITATITPQAGFTGDVTVTATFPAQSLSFTAPTTNPFVVHFANANAQTKPFKIHFNSQQGTPSGDIVLSATDGTHTHTANLHITVS